MKNLSLVSIILLLLTGSSAGQDTYYSIFNYSNFIPKVRVNDHAVSLQENLYPRFYRTHSVTGDMRWVSQNDSSLMAFWQQQGDTVLHILREFSGIQWHESEFDIYLVRYFPTIGSSDPLIIPIGGLQSGGLIEAAPEGSRQILNLVFQLAKRMLAQAYQPEDGIYHPIVSHRLMNPGPYRRDNLAMLLAVNTCQNIIGIDSTYAAYRSTFWRERFPGKEVFERYFLDSWLLSPKRTLADWVLSEPENSDLVMATRPPRPVKTVANEGPRPYIEDLPLKGQLGFTARNNGSGNLVVEKVDVYRLGYACGLKPDDVIRRVDGRMVRNFKTLVEYTLEGMERRGGATYEIVRDGYTEQIVMQPIRINFLKDSTYDDDSFETTDTLYEDSLIPGPGDN
ncbi:MAG: hypothetical protein AB1483_02695 [Candidatus Zixiibacteriota bacterium]